MWESVRGSGCRGTHFYFGATRAMKLTEEWAQKNIDRTLDGVEVVSLEETGGRRHRVVRLYADHPDGVNHALCARVSGAMENALDLSLIHISEPTRLRRISYAVFCLKK